MTTQKSTRAPEPARRRAGPSPLSAQRPALSADRRAGGLLVIRLLEEIRDTAFEDLLIEDDTVEDCYRSRGKPQLDLVAAYLLRLRTPEMAAGFTALLTHILAMHEHSGAPALEMLGLLATMPPAQAHLERRRKLARDQVAAAKKHLRSLDTESQS